MNSSSNNNNDNAEGRSRPATGARSTAKKSSSSSSSNNKGSVPKTARSGASRGATTAASARRPMSADSPSRQRRVQRAQVYDAWRKQCEINDACRKELEEACGKYGVASEYWPISQWRMTPDQMNNYRSAGYTFDDLKEGRRCVTHKMFTTPGFVDDLNRSCPDDPDIPELVARYTRAEENAAASLATSAAFRTKSSASKSGQSSVSSRSAAASVASKKQPPRQSSAQNKKTSSSSSSTRK